MTPNRKRLLIGGIVVVLLIGVFYLASITSTERENISKLEQILQVFWRLCKRGPRQSPLILATGALIWRALTICGRKMRSCARS